MDRVDEQKTTITMPNRDWRVVENQMRNASKRATDNGDYQTASYYSDLADKVAIWRL